MKLYRIDIDPIKIYIGTMKKGDANSPYYQESDPKRLQIFRNSSLWNFAADLNNVDFRFVSYSPDVSLKLSHSGVARPFFCKHVKGILIQ